MLKKAKRPNGRTAEWQNGVCFDLPMLIPVLQLSNQEKGQNGGMEDGPNGKADALTCLCSSVCHNSATRQNGVFVSFLLVLLLCFLSNISGHAQKTIPADIKVLLDKHICGTCHKLDEKLIGPGYIELSSRGQSVKEISALIYEPKPSNWPGYPPMAPMPHLPKEDVKKIAAWIVSLRESKSK